MRGRRRTELVKQFYHHLALDLGPFADRRAAADVGVLLLDLGRPTTCDPRSHVLLERTERNEVRVVEEVGQERLDLGNLLLVR